MENTSRKKVVSCRLVPHQDSGRVRWCVGHQQKWQKWLKRLALVPIILLPIVVVLILITKYNIGGNPEPGSHSQNLSLVNNISLSSDVKTRYKRCAIPEKRFLHLFKHCYKLYRKLHPDRELFLETEINRAPKLDYLDENPPYFRSNFLAYFRENQDKHRKLKNCFNKFWISYKKSTVFQQRKRYKRNNTKQDILNESPMELSNAVRNVWTNSYNLQEVREEQSKLMRKYMNFSVNPCDNFYEYACGNWKKYFEIPPDKTVFDTFEMVRERLYLVLKELLDSNVEIETADVDKSSYHNAKDFIEENYVIYDDSDAIIKAKRFYKSCMNKEKIDKRGEKPLKKLLEGLGGWPLASPEWNKDDFDLMWVLSRLRLLNNDILISQWIGPDIKDSNKHIIHIDQTTLGLPNRDYFLDPSNSRFTKAYKSFILSVAYLLGAQTSVALQDVNDLVEFETKLASILSPWEERRNLTDIYQRFTIETLMVRYPDFAWSNYFTTILGKEIDLKSTVACYCARYIRQLLNLLSKTNPRVIQNYLLWRFIRHRINHLDHRFKETEQKFFQALLGREQQPPRWQFCVSQTNMHLGMAVGALFVKHYFDETSKVDTIAITEEIMHSFTSTLREKHWLDDETKNFAEMKIKNMNRKIGFPNFLLNQTSLNLFYNDVKIEEQFFFENVLSVLRHASRQDRQKVGLAVDKSLWSTAPAVINAYYSRNKNQITGILQPPFYHKFFPKSLNFGGIGVVIGHEITHAFDDKGRLFDHEGNLQLWWTNDAIEKFFQKSQCIIDQYGQYVLPGMQAPLDGVITQGENIADNGGLKQSFKAYQLWALNNTHADETLPGLTMTGAQLFFLNFAQVWCGKQRIESARNQLKTSVHAPGMFRVIGALSNSAEFADVFSCPSGSPMNPEKKCDLW
ncbi:neprilysin-4 isoform X2 [Dendroctonus ponderosae]|uniref:Peptidase M13 C-terminal domain-containing protein n=1 Tax=Dendroctonus ponderosae TaxID=77166 RepID=A0AAR5PXA8_DENPD|nr:neprilysin-4 isoform X2 [Dendroctonus ponderosae]KAH1023619.1 hypothetical protein HUJ04_012786 [Dendroctonus ponderosae]KAH1030072.1 hypothetical protein HUJ05_003204 [Dendroctonus ponderosae]